MTNKEAYKRWCENNREKLNAYMREYRKSEKQKEYHREYYRAWSKANPDKVKAQRKKRL